MKRVGVFIQVLLLLTASMIVASPVRSETPTYLVVLNTYWGIDQPIEVSPGDVSALNVVLRWESSFSVRSITAILTLPQGFQAVGGTDKARTQYSGTTSLGTIIKLDFPIFITRDATIGNYTADLELEFYLASYTTYKELHKVPLEVTGKPRLEVNSQTDYLHEGKQQVSLIIQNKGDAAAESIKLLGVGSNNSPIELQGSTLLGRLESNKNVTVPLKIYVITGLKSTSLAMELTYVGPKGVLYNLSESLLLPVRASIQIPAVSITVEPEELTIGKTTNLSLNIVNSGGIRLTDVKLELSADAIIKIFGNTVFHMDKLEMGESQHIYTKIYIPSTTTSPTALLTVTTTYIDERSGIVQTESQRLNMLLRGFIDISLTDMAVIPSTPSPGTSFSITITITNIGTSTAYATYAIPLIGKLPLKTFGPKSVYIGNVEINQPTTFTVNLQMDTTKEKTLTLPIALSYIDNLRSQYNITLTASITVGTTQTTTQPQNQQRGFEIFGIHLITLVLLIGISAAVIVLFVIVRRRKRRTE